MLALFNPITLMLASICVEWFAVAQAGPFTIKLPYLALFLVILYSVSSPRRNQLLPAVCSPKRDLDHSISFVPCSH